MLFSSSVFCIKIYRVIGFFDWRTPFFLIRDPETIKNIAIRDFDYFENHRSFVDESTDVLFKNCLYMLSGQKWREMRGNLTIF